MVLAYDWFQAAVCSASVRGIVGTICGAGHACIGLKKSGCSALHHMVDVLVEVRRSEAWALKYVTAENQLWHCLQACSLGNKSNCAVADPWASWHIPQLASS